MAHRSWLSAADAPVPETGRMELTVALWHNGAGWEYDVQLTAPDPRARWTGAAVLRDDAVFAVRGHVEHFLGVRGDRARG
jgi:hypothetical protein